MCAFLTLSPSAADLPEAGALTQTIEALLFDQLHDLWLDFLPKLPGETSEDLHKKRLKNIIHKITYSLGL